MGWLYKTLAPEKLLPQLTLQRTQQCCRRIVLILYTVKPSLAGKLCRSNFQISSSLTIISETKFLGIYRKSTNTEMHKIEFLLI